MVPLAYGNDGGGSIRVPAACNGIVGFKPSRDRVPAGPDNGDLLCGLGCEFALTRSVRDAAALLDAVAGADVGAPGIPSPPARPFLAEVKQQPGRLRIAWTTTPASGAAIDPECVAAVHATVRLLEDLGHEVVADRPRYDWQAFLDSTHVLFMSGTAAMIDALAVKLGRKPGPDNLEAVTLACYAERIFAHVCFTGLFNWTGQPAVPLPLHWSAAGLPVGVQLAAGLGDEATLFRLSAQLEQARPWADRRPPLHAAGPAQGNDT